MKKLIFTMLGLITFFNASAQLEVSAEFGFMRSVSRFDESLDPENSMNPMTVNATLEQIHVTHEIWNYFYAGVHFAYHSQKSGVGYNMDYFNKQQITANFYEGSVTHQPSTEYRPLEKYFMVGPEFNTRFQTGRSFKFEVGTSLLLYDNRQASEDFGNSLKNQVTDKNYSYDMWHNIIYAYRHDAEFLNGWNLKVNGNFKILITPFKSRAHTLFLAFSAGRSIKQNYAVNYRTNKPNSETETNVVRISNYGAYYGISVGYNYLFEFRKRP